MRRLISQCLIISILYAGVAWAADTHAEAYFGHGAEWSQGADNQPDTGNGVDTCDHCCHGSAHYVGFPIAESVMTCDRKIQKALRNTNTHHSLILSPPTQPPKA